MGLTDEEFGGLSLMSFELLNKRLDAKRDHDYVCAGIVASTVANVNCDRDKRPEGFAPLDFVPGYKPPAARVLTPEEQVAAFQRLFCPPEQEVIRVKQ